MDTKHKKIIITLVIASFVLSSTAGAVFGFLGGIAGNGVYNWIQSKTGMHLPVSTDTIKNTETVTTVKEESAVIDAVKKVSPAVVSIIVTKDVPKIEQYWSDPFGGGNSPFERFFFPFSMPMQRQNGTEKQEVGGGTGFIVSDDGMILTNKHVVSDKDAEYTVLANDGEKYEAKVLARDDTNDLAILKIEKNGLPTVELGDSDSIVIGQTVIAIGNALGEFRNTVSVGVVSGLSRSITAGGNVGEAEQLTGVIQTDAAINPGNSGGPLLNIKGQVIGIDTAIVKGAQNIGFAIPINDAKSDIQSVKETGRIRKPYLGVRYTMINKTIQQKNNLDVDYGALILRGAGEGDLAVIPGSPADKAGLVENDIILEVDGIKLNRSNSLANIIGKKKIGDKINLKVLHKGEEKTIEVALEERKID